MKNRRNSPSHGRSPGRVVSLILAGLLLCAGPVGAEEPVIENQADEISAQGDAALASILNDIRRESRERMDRQRLSSIQRTERDYQVVEKKLPDPGGVRVTQCELSIPLNDCPFNCYHDFSIGGVSWVSLVD